MAIKGYHILSLEAKDIYKQEQINGVEQGYVLPEKKGRAYFDLFKNVLNYSLDLIELKYVYEKQYRRKTGFDFKDEYQNQYTFEVINLKFNYTYEDNGNKKDLKELRKYFYEKGFNFNGIHYVRYKRSSGSSRQGNCLFIDEKLLKPMEKWGECGLNPKGDLASWESYKSLSLSSLKGTIDIPLNGILFIPDYKSEFLEEVVSVEEKDGALFASTKETTIENDIWDGESLLDESLFGDKYVDRQMLLLRNKFFKSCGFKTKLQKWFKDKNITLDDLKSRGFITLATDISQIVMVTTPNSMKFLKFMKGGFEEINVRKWIDKVDSTFGVVKYDKRTKFFGGKMVQSSYQFINTLGFNEEQVDELLKPSKDYLTTIRSDYDFMHYHYSEAYKGEKEEDREETADGLEERSKVIFALMEINYGFKDTTLYRNFRNELVKNQKDRLKQGHILLLGTNATLFGNGPEMLLALSGEFDLQNNKNKSSILGKGEIACKKFDNGEKLVCARSPHITMGNLYCATNNLSNDIWNYFDLGENIVCVNAIEENIQQRLNGCDYDSDAMLITNDKLIVETAFKQKDLFKVPVCDIEPNRDKKPELWELDYNTSENKIGEIVNLSQKLNSILWDRLNNGDSYENVQGIYEDVCKLAVLSGIEIDKAKRAYDNIEVYKELKTIYDRYGSVRPNFFRILDESEIERQVKGVWDKDKIKRKQLRDKKREELWAKKEYFPYKTAMAFVYKQVEHIDYHKGKPKEAKKRPIFDMIKIPKMKKSTSYEHRDKIVSICEESKERLAFLYMQLSNADDDEKEVIYTRIIQTKEERNEKVKAQLSEEYVLYLVLKEYEKTSGENWHLYAPLLENELFKSMLKGSKEKMQKVETKDDGEYDLYGLKFTKN